MNQVLGVAGGLGIGRAKKCLLDPRRGFTAQAARRPIEARAWRGKATLATVPDGRPTGFTSPRQGT